MLCLDTPAPGDGYFGPISIKYEREEHVDQSETRVMM